MVAAGLDELLAAVRRRAAGARVRAALVGRAADAHLAFFAAHPDVMRILHQARGLLQFDRPESPRLRRLLAGHVERLAAVLGGGAAAGTAARRERAAARLLFGAVSGLASVGVGPAGAAPRGARSLATRRALVALVLAFEGRPRR